MNYEMMRFIEDLQREVESIRREIEKINNLPDRNEINARVALDMIGFHTTYIKLRLERAMDIATYESTIRDIREGNKKEHAPKDAFSNGQEKYTPVMEF